MTNNNSGAVYKNILIGVVAVLVLGTAVASTAYFVKQPTILEAKAPVQHTTTIIRERPQAATVTDCDDNNVVGMAVGGLAGGLLGNQVGKGSGKTAATIGGALGGAYLGKEALPTRNVTCR